MAAPRRSAPARRRAAPRGRRPAATSGIPSSGRTSSGSLIARRPGGRGRRPGAGRRAGPGPGGAARRARGSGRRPCRPRSACAARLPGPKAKPMTSGGLSRSALVPVPDRSGTRATSGRGSPPPPGGPAGRPAGGPPRSPRRAVPGSRPTAPYRSPAGRPAARGARWRRSRRPSGDPPRGRRSGRRRRPRAAAAPAKLRSRGPPGSGLITATRAMPGGRDRPWRACAAGAARSGPGAPRRRAPRRAWTWPARARGRARRRRRGTDRQR